MRCVSARNEVCQCTQDKNDNGSVMTQKETNWSVHWEIMETQGYLFDIHTKKSETVPFRKRRNCGSPHNKRVMYEIKGKKEVCSSWSSIVWQSHKLSGTVPVENWRIYVAMHTWKKEDNLNPKERKYGSDSLRHLQ